MNYTLSSTQNIKDFNYLRALWNILNIFRSTLTVGGF
jgi:hypothetical protein